MKCDRWNLLIGGDMGPAEIAVFSEHCDQCSECRQQWERWQELELDCLAAANLFGSDESEQQSLERATASKGQSAGRWVYALVAAIVLGAFGLLYGLWQANFTPAHQPNRNLAQGSSNSEAEPQPLPATEEQQFRNRVFAIRDAIIARELASKKSNKATDDPQVNPLGTSDGPQRTAVVSGQGLSGEPTEFGHFRVVPVVMYFKPNSNPTENFLEQGIQ